MKKVLALILALVMVGAMVACSGKTATTTTTSTTEATATETKKVDYPTKAIKLVIPFAAGGSSDMVSRPMAETLGQILGVNVTCENQAGASGTIGTAAVVAAKADGYTILNASNSPITVAPCTQQLAYSVSDLKPIGRTVIMPTCLTVSASSPYTTLQEYVDALKANPSSITVGTPGAGSTHHLTLEHFCNVAGVKANHVPYEGANPAVVALLGGHVDSTLTGIPEVTNYHKDGSLRILCVFTEERLEVLPDVPTANELGFVTGDRSAWYGVMVSKDVPDEIVAILSNALEKACQDPTFVETATKLNMIPAFMPAEEFGKLIATESEVNLSIAKAIGLAQ